MARVATKITSLQSHVGGGQPRDIMQARLKLLLVEDDAFIRMDMAEILQDLGYDVIEADSGTLGLKKLETSDFNLAIVDIYLPGIDGVKVIKQIRERVPELPIIAMSGVQLNSSDRTALDFFSMLPALSTIPCLKKPFRPKDLTEAIYKVMGVAA